MEQELWRKVEELFHAALERTVDARQTFLDRTCNGDIDLRRRVDLLLAKEKQVGSFLERPAIENMPVILTLARSLVGQQFGPYQIVSALGAGGMGEVYRAHDRKLGRDVAIKTLPHEFARDPERLSRLRREARTLASLNHPNIAAIYGLEESEEADCLVMELVEGEMLRGPLPIGTALDRACQLALALEAAHGKRIIHRDLKPANVKVTPQGTVKVLDFGLAKAIWWREGNRDLSQLAAVKGVESVAGQIVGTPGYMSPEQALGRDVDKRTDIWAFGCLLYELLTGKRAFAGETLQDTIASVLEGEPNWQALPAKTPAPVRELLRHCLQKDPARRLHNIEDARRTIEKAQRGRNRWRVTAIAAAALAMLAIGAALWLRNVTHLPGRSQWVALTKLPDSVVQPALSPDGRMLAFIRGDSTFFGMGQVYVKRLPDGQPVQLTHDSMHKMSPVFSADGARIAYTTVDLQFNWDTWVVPTQGGEPRQFLRNASGLVWSGPHQVLFSEMEIGKAPHMGIVAAEESRLGERNVYFPADAPGMAHRSYPSPDGKWVLLVEMNRDHVWVPCRLVPMDGTSIGRSVGPPKASCTFGAWSPDGRWMYFSSEAGGLYHIWRQRFPDGQPQQVTSGPTEEEGLAMAPDGRSFVTAVALENVSVWIHDARGQRQISLEGNAADPKFTPDGKKLCYRIVTKTPNEFQFSREAGEVWVADLESGRSAPLALGFQAAAYDISADGGQVVMEAEDREGKPRLWLTSFERPEPPHSIPNVEGRQPRFGPGEIFFRGTDGIDGFVYRVRPDGTGMRRALEQPILTLYDVSPDGRWIVGWSRLPGNEAPSNYAFPVGGGPPVQLSDAITLQWSPGGGSLFISELPFAEGRSYIVPLPPGKSLPPVPAAGFSSEEEVARLPGARRTDILDVVPGQSPDVYAFTRINTQRNLYRIPAP
ncbi:MAG TPA: protein kinase [Bryobacteraceae bacterium]|nr:protein kinase [Bryobacteraceae bacterium]